MLSLKPKHYPLIFGIITILVGIALGIRTLNQLVDRGLDPERAALRADLEPARQESGYEIIFTDHECRGYYLGDVAYIDSHISINSQNSRPTAYIGNDNLMQLGRESAAFANVPGYRSLFEQTSQGYVGTVLKHEATGNILDVIIICYDEIIPNGFEIVHLRKNEQGAIEGLKS